MALDVFSVTQEPIERSNIMRSSIESPFIGLDPDESEEHVFDDGEGFENLVPLAKGEDPDAFSEFGIANEFEDLYDEDELEDKFYDVDDDHELVFDQLAWSSEQPATALGDSHFDSDVDPEQFLPPFPLLRPVRRAIKMELQTRNRVFRVRPSGKRKLLPRKFGPPETQFLHKGKRGRPARGGDEGTAIELQSEARGFVEFETPKWFRSWCALKKRIDEAVSIIKEIEDPKNLVRTVGGIRTYNFPFDISHLRRRRGFRKGLRKGETLQVEVVDSTWNAKIQVSEKLELKQFHSYMEEHIGTATATRIRGEAQSVLNKANTQKIQNSKLINLHSLLEIILEYIWAIERTSKHREEWKKKNPSKKEKIPLAKEHIHLMSRTNFSSIYRVLLSDDEKKLFRTIVKRRLVLKEKGLSRRSPMFRLGYTGRIPRRSGLKRKKALTVHLWLRSIHKRKRDLLARIRGDNRAMGRFEVPTWTSKDRYLVRFEARGTRIGQNQPASKWVAFAKKAFELAFTNRSRPGSSLKYQPKKCP